MQSDTSHGLRCYYCFINIAVADVSVDLITACCSFVVLVMIVPDH